MSDTIASFNVEYTRFLDPSGRATRPFPDSTSDRATLVKLYRALEHWQTAGHATLPLSVSFDHRAVTEVEAASFLRAVIEDLEKAE
jgi:hypothetical protein